MIKLKNIANDNVVEVLRKMNALSMDRESARIFSEFTKKADELILEARKVYNLSKEKIEAKDPEAVISWLKYLDGETDVKPLPSVFLDFLGAITPTEYAALEPLVLQKRDLKAVNE